MAYFSDDPVADFERYDRDQERLLERRPKCRNCNEHIQNEHYFYIDGRIWCHECMVEEFRRNVEVDFYA